VLLGIHAADLEAGLELLLMRRSLSELLRRALLLLLIITQYLIQLANHIIRASKRITDLVMSLRQQVLTNRLLRQVVIEWHIKQINLLLRRRCLLTAINMAGLEIVHLSAILSRDESLSLATVLDLCKSLESLLHIFIDK